MASSTSFTVFLSPPNPSLSPSSSPTILLPSAAAAATCALPLRISTFSHSSSSTTTAKRRNSFSVSAAARSLEALIFDCDGVILESEHLHRQAYNDAFSHFNVRCPTPANSSFSDEPLNWSLEFYDVFQNQIGGGKPKMRWYVMRNFNWMQFSLFLRLSRVI